MKTFRAALVIAALATVGSAVACDPGKPSPTSEQCHFRGNDVACVQHWDGQPDTTTVDSPDYDLVAGDPGPDYDALSSRFSGLDHPSAWPPAPEPGREQYLTPYEDSLSNDDRPFAPERHCRDGSSWLTSVKTCPDGNPGTVSWVHHDGTRVTINPDSPTGIRWNGGQVQ